MARKPRIEYEGAFYHVITRGNRREKIFRDRKDFLKYLDILTHYKKHHQFYLYSYVLMSNHIHLLVETKKIPLSKIQQGINQSYTMYFNRRHKTIGHLFHGRYKAILCDMDAYLLSLVKYIHMNPVKAGMARDLRGYRWSSHGDYAGKGKNNSIVETDRVLRMFSEDKAMSRKLYREFMGNGINVKRDDIYKTIDRRVLGNEEFLDSVMENHDVEIKKKMKVKEYTLGDIANGVERITGIKLKELRTHNKVKHIAIARKLFILVAGEYSYVSNEIAEYIMRDPAIISRALRDIKQLEEDVGKVVMQLKNVNLQA